MFTEYALNALLKQTYARTMVDCALFALPPLFLLLVLHTRAHPMSIYHDQARKLSLTPRETSPLDGKEGRRLRNASGYHT